MEKKKKKRLNWILKLLIRFFLVTCHFHRLNARPCLRTPDELLWYTLLFIIGASCELLCTGGFVALLGGSGVNTRPL